MALNRIEDKLTRNLEMLGHALDNEEAAIEGARLGAVDHQGLKDRLKEICARIKAAMPAEQ